MQIFENGMHFHVKDPFEFDLLQQSNQIKFILLLLTDKWMAYKLSTKI